MEQQQQPEHIRLDPERTMGVEILSFPGVEIEQTIGSKHSFNTVGTLDLLYFSDYGRFVLSLRHWNFPLFKELPIIKSSEGFVDPIIYILPIDDGFYTLKLTQVFHVEAIENLETIFKHNSSFISGTDAHALMNGGFDYEPLPRTSLYGSEEPEPHRTGLSNTPNKEGSASKLRKRDIIKREVIRAADTIVQGIQKKKKDNVNMNILRDYEDLLNTTEDLAPVQYLYRKDVEKMILNASELIRRIEGDNELADVYPVEHRGFLNTLRSSAREVRDRLYFRLLHFRDTATAGGSTHDESQPRTSFGEKLVNMVPAIGKCYHPSHDYADHEYEVHLPSYLVNREDLNQAIYTGEVHHQQSLLNKLKEKIPPMPSCGRSDMTTDRESTLTIMERLDHAIHHPRATADQTFDYNPAGPNVIQRVKAKIPGMVLKVRENFEHNRTSDDQAPPDIREKLKVDLEALKIQATEYAHLARENETVVRAVNEMKYGVPEKIHNIRESFQNPHLEGQPHPTLGEKVADNLKGFKHQVEEYAHLIAENEKVAIMVDKVKAGLHDIRDQLDSRKNMDMSIYDVPVDPMLRADSISCMEDFQMKPVDIQPLHDTNPQASLSERITDIFIGQLQAGNMEERPHRASLPEHEPLDFVCTIPSHNHHRHELQEQAVEIQQERPLEEPIQEEVLLPQEFHEGVLMDQPVTMLDERLTQSEPAPDLHDRSRPDLLTEELAATGMKDLQERQSEPVVISGENNVNVLENIEAAPIYQEKEAVMDEPEIAQSVEQLEAVESQRRRVHIFDDKPIVGTNVVVRSHRTPKKIFDGVQRAVRNSQEFESMTHSHG